jgi:hypothetical protein
MSLAPNDLPDARLTELLADQVDRYEAIVARLANNGVRVKTWCVTTIGAVSAVAVNNHRSGLFAVALAILAVFMVLDVQYLWLERRFREGSHELVRRVESGEVDRLREFFTNRPPPRSRRGSVVEVIRSFTIFPFYLGAGLLLLLGLVTT